MDITDLQSQGDFSVVSQPTDKEHSLSGGPTDISQLDPSAITMMNPGNSGSTPASTDQSFTPSDLVKGPLNSLLVRPATRVAQAATQAVSPLLPNDIQQNIQRNLQGPSSTPIPGLGDIQNPPLKTGEQAAGETLDTAGNILALGTGGEGSTVTSRLLGFGGSGALTGAGGAMQNNASPGQVALAGGTGFVAGAVMSGATDIMGALVKKLGSQSLADAAVNRYQQVFKPTEEDIQNGSQYRALLTMQQKDPALYQTVVDAHPERFNKDGTLKFIAKPIPNIEIIKLDPKQFAGNMNGLNLTVDQIKADETIPKSDSSNVPIQVRQLEDGSYKVIDGNHRIATAIKNGDATITAQVVPDYQTQAANAPQERSLNPSPIKPQSLAARALKDLPAGSTQDMLDQVNYNLNTLKGDLTKEAQQSGVSFQLSKGDTNNYISLLKNVKDQFSNSEGKTAFSATAREAQTYINQLQRNGGTMGPADVLELRQFLDDIRKTSDFNTNANLTPKAEQFKGAADKLRAMFNDNVPGAKDTMSKFVDNFDYRDNLLQKAVREGKAAPFSLSDMVFAAPALASGNPGVALEGPIARRLSSNTSVQTNLGRALQGGSNAVASVNNLIDKTIGPRALSTVSGPLKVAGRTLVPSISGVISKQVVPTQELKVQH